MYTPNVVLSRKVRALPTGSTYLTYQDPGFAIYYEKLQVCTIGSDKKSTCQILKTTLEKSLNIEKSTEKAFNVTINTDQQPVHFEIVFDAGYFDMRKLKYGDKSFRVIPLVQAPTNFAFYCGNKVFYQVKEDDANTQASLTLVFNSLQMQAPFSSKIPVDKSFRFGDAWHCVPFVSIPILAGLFVCAILLAILGVGICWLMDINTMDRFDDPKGKTITINASEG